METTPRITGFVKIDEDRVYISVNGAGLETIERALWTLANNVYKRERDAILTMLSSMVSPRNEDGE